jgi:Zn-finger nucleic acid-binding protein
MSLEGGTTTPMRCPSCGSRLVEVERADVLIDACPECRGVWLDRGELDKILVRERRMHSGHDDDDDFLREVEGQRRVPEPRRDDDRHRDDERYRDDDRYRGERKRRKRRSFLEDLLDFD